MTGSYVMVDPAGRFFDNAAGSLTPTAVPILEIGVEQALMDVFVDAAEISVQERYVCLVTAEPRKKSTSRRA